MCPSGGEISQRKGDLTEVPNEPPVKIGKPQKSLDRSMTLLGGPISNCIYFGRIHSDTIGMCVKTRSSPPWRINDSQVAAAALA